jgi:hypothetical protein
MNTGQRMYNIWGTSDLDVGISGPVIRTKHSNVTETQTAQNQDWKKMEPAFWYTLKVCLWMCKREYPGD